ncbi:MAG: hypothetical protein HKO53_14070 [Gemmatimonadetes bacterium]|nr:hypothetical protein [Gemmatimonadota bacterium]
MGAQKGNRKRSAVTRALSVLSFGAALLLVGGIPADAQRPGQSPSVQQMQEMQARLQRMSDVMGRMQHIQERAQAMEHNMIQQLDRLRSQDRLSDQDRLRIRDQERVRDMAHAMSTAAREMRQAMERVRDMAGDQDSPWSREMHQEMERLRENWNGLCDQMEEGLELMERIQERLGQPGT